MEFEAARRTMDEYEEHLLTVYRSAGEKFRGILPKPAQVIYDAVNKVLATVIRGLDKSNTFYRHRMLFGHLKGPSYVLTQYLGNATMLGVAGEWGSLLRYANPRDGVMGARRSLLQSIEDLGTRQGLSRAEINRRMFQIDPAVSNYSKTMEALGSKGGKARHELYQGQSDAMLDPVMGSKWLNKLPGRPGRLLGTKKYAQWGAYMDGGMREVLGDGFAHRSLRNDVIPDYRNQTINRMVTDWGMSRETATRIWNDFTEAHPSGLWSFNDVEDFFSDHLPKGRAVRLARDWQSAVNDLERRIEDHLGRISFAGEETRADIVLKRMFIFHHFLSRQSFFYASQALHHPFLLNVYFNMQEELEKASEGWPDYMKGWVEFLSVGGVTMLLNPVGLFSSFISFADQGGFYTPEDITEVGEWAKTVESIIGINPLVKNTFNLLGVYGDEAPADPLAIWREDRLITAGINWIRYFTGHTPVASKYDQLMLDLREELSDFNPLRDEPVLARSAQADMDRDIQIILIDEMVRRGLDPNDPAAWDAAVDPESDLYQTALRRYLLGETSAIATDTFLGPFRPRIQQTNEDGKPIYPNLSDDLKDRANTTDRQATQLETQRDAYDELNPLISNTLDTWNEIAYGHVTDDLTVGGRTYTADEINAMPPATRRELANAMLEEYGLLDDANALREERDAFLADPDNAEFAQFKTWQSAVADYEGGVDAYWTDLIEQNPNAAIYFNEIVDTIPEGPRRDRALMSMGAFMSIIGVQPNAFAPNPTVTNANDSGVYDPVGVASGQAMPQPLPEASEYEEAVRDAPQVLRDFEEWDEVVEERQQEMGFGTGDFDDLPSWQRIDVEESLEEDGVYEPEMPRAVTNYIEWAEKQPPGADTSIDAYLRWNQRNYEQGSLTRFEDLYEQGPLAGGNDQTIWSKLVALLDEHDHTRP
jgi:hypothetical protein